MKQHIWNKRNMTPGRVFITGKGMAELKKQEAIIHAVAKRDGVKIEGVTQRPCGCGGEECFHTTPMKSSGTASLKKIKKKRTYATSAMFNGRIVIS